MWRFSCRCFDELDWIREARKLRSVKSKIPFNIRFWFLKTTLHIWSPWHAMHFLNRDRKLTVTAQLHTALSRRYCTLVTLEFWLSSRSFLALYAPIALLQGKIVWYSLNGRLCVPQNQPVWTVGIDVCKSYQYEVKRIVIWCCVSI
jgi:hypothetical protein